MDWHWDNPIIRQIVGRVHIGKSNIYAIKYFVSCFKHKYKTFCSLPKSERKELMLSIIRCFYYYKNLI